MRVPAVPATAASTAWAVRSSCTPKRVSSSRIGATNCSGYVIRSLYLHVDLRAEQHRAVVVVRRPLGERLDAPRRLALERHMAVGFHPDRPAEVEDVRREEQRE